MACLTNYAVQCTDVATGKIGVFLFDTTHWQETGEFRAVSPVFPGLSEFFAWDNANGPRRESIYLERISNQMSRPTRVATICHNEDDPRTGRRVRLELTKKDESGYAWRTEFGEDCNLGVHKTVYDAEIAALQAWGADVWDLRAKWRQ